MTIDEAVELYKSNGGVAFNDHPLFSTEIESELFDDELFIVSTYNTPFRERYYDVVRFTNNFCTLDCLTMWFSYTNKKDAMFFLKWYRENVIKSVEGGRDENYLD